MSYKYQTNRYRKGFRWRVKSPKRIKMKMSPVVFSQTEKLYHYTTLDNAIAIISTGCFRMSKFEKMNDINESYRPILCYIEDYDSDKDYEKLDVAERELQNYRQASMTIDDTLPGFALSTMWGHYADNGKGVCIVFDKWLLLEKLRIGGAYYPLRIKYTDNYDCNIFITGDPAKYFRDNINALFFEKSDEWKHEQEFRIIRYCRDKPSNFYVNDCIIAIIMCYGEEGSQNDEPVFNSANYRRLKSLFPDIPILEWSNGPCGYTLRDDDDKSWYPEPEKYDIDI